MNNIITQFFETIAGTGNAHSFVLGMLSFFISGVILLFLIEPITD